MSEPLQQDQDDFHALIDGDEYFVNIAALNERKGVTESDVETALGPLNEKGTKIGACAVVCVPELLPDDADTPAPRYFVRICVQAIVQPLLADDATSGVQKTVEDVCERIRQLCHFRSFGRSCTFMFDGMEPILSVAGTNSFGIYFKRMGGDNFIAKVAPVAISSTIAIAPAAGWEVTLNVAGGAAAYYTTDGSQPTVLNGTAYVAPFNVPAACTVRAAAVQAGFLQSETTQKILS